MAADENWRRAEVQWHGTRAQARGIAASGEKKLGTFFRCQGSALFARRYQFSFPVNRSPVSVASAFLRPGKSVSRGEGAKPAREGLSAFVRQPGRLSGIDLSPEPQGSQLAERGSMRKKI